MFYIYLITNIIKNKIYIGQTIKPKQRWGSHKRQAKKNNENSYLIHRAINKYGEDNFTFKIIAACETQEDANKSEELMIEILNSLNPNGYNMRKGGNATLLTEETKQKMSTTRRNKGFKHTEETKKIMSESAKGRKVNEEVKQKISKANTGKKRTEEDKQKMSETHKNIENSGRFVKGQEFSEEFRNKLSNSLIGNKNSLGHKHSEETKKSISESQKKITNSGRFAKGFKMSKEIIEKREATRIRNKLAKQNSGEK